MSYRKLLEGATTLMINHITQNIGAALDEVASVVVDPQMTLENPREYYIYPKPVGYELPCVFVIADDGMDFRIQDKKSNFVNALDSFKVSILVEDQTETNLTYKAWRYLSAMHSVLDEANILNTDESLKLVVNVTKTRISETFMRTEGSGDGGKFRKEILLECDVDHYESF